MAASDASAFPPRGVAFRLGVSFRTTSGVLITGWTGASATVYVDGSAAGTATPTEYGSLGMGYIDLTAAQMNGALIQIVATVTNTGNVATQKDIYTGALAQMASAGLAGGASTLGRI
jgi:hypothetical protein